MKATDFFRALDDSDLDPYETRYLLRVWRRGSCWEKVDSIAKTTGMSRRQAYYARASLLEKGWLTEDVQNNRVVYVVAIPSCCVDAHDAQDVQEMHEVVQEVHEVVQEMHALPIKRPKEDHNTKARAAAPPTADPIEELDRHFHAITLLHPPVDPKSYVRTWEEPLRTFLAHAQGDVEKAKELIAQAVELARNPTWRERPYPISNPHSVVNIGTQQIARSQDEARPAAAVADDDTLWQRAVAAVTRSDYTDGRLKAAIYAIGGTGRIRSANGHDTESLKRSLGHAYRNAAPA